MMQDIKAKHAKKTVEESEQESKIHFTKKLFSDDFKLKDYSATKFTLEEAGKDIIKNAREFHSSPALIKWDAYNENICAGYVFELSRQLWDPSAPYMIGMMEQETKKPADAWQLPYSYEYVWWKILSDFTGDFSVDEKNYWEKIDTNKLKDFFNTAFSEAALFWDIGFLYRDTEYLHELKIYQNSNSHITKNIWVSNFSRTVKTPDNNNHLGIFSKTLWCDTDISEKMLEIIPHYNISLDGKKIVFFEGEFYYLAADSTLKEKVEFRDMSELTFQDITLMHFFEWAKVESLLEMTCKGEFFPINIMSINPRYIEKM